MKSMLAAFAATMVIAIGANFILDSIGFSAQEAQTGSAVRLDGSGQ